MCWWLLPNTAASHLTPISADMSEKLFSACIMYFKNIMWKILGNSKKYKKGQITSTYEIYFEQSDGCYE